MLDATDLLKMVKEAAMQTIESGQPSDFCFGKVTSTSPLKVKVESKMELGSAQLVLTRNVTDYEVNVTMNWTTEKSSEPEHNHDIKGKKKIKIHNGLVTGDEVVLLKKKGGQKYLILDKVVNA